MVSAETHRGNREASGGESYGRSLDNRFRTYDPSIGRYISADPIGQLGILDRAGVRPERSLGQASDPSEAFPRIQRRDVNLFRYALDNPPAFIDPTGEIGLAGLGVAVAVAVIIDVAINTESSVDTDSGTLTTKVPPPSTFDKGLPLPFFFGAEFDFGPVNVPGLGEIGLPIGGRLTCDPSVVPPELGADSSQEPGLL